MAPNDSFVPLRDELKALPKFITDEFRGTILSQLTRRILLRFLPHSRIGTQELVLITNQGYAFDHVISYHISFHV